MTSTNPNAPAFPCSVERGISTRTYLAGLTMQGLAACPGISASDDTIATAAVSMADALIRALNKPTT